MNQRWITVEKVDGHWSEWHGDSVTIQYSAMIHWWDPSLRIELNLRWIDSLNRHWILMWLLYLLHRVFPSQTWSTRPSTRPTFSTVAKGWSWGLDSGIGLMRPTQKPNLQSSQLLPQLHIIIWFGGDNSQFEAKLRLELASSCACLKHPDEGKIDSRNRSSHADEGIWHGVM